MPQQADNGDPRRASPRPGRRRGVALLLALVAVVISTTLAYSYLGAQGTAVGVANNIRGQTQARYLAEAGLEMALAFMSSQADWRTAQAAGTWVSDEPSGAGSFSIIVEDGEDTDGDGVVDGDGDLADDASDRVTIRAIGMAGGARHVARAVVTPVPGDGRSVLMLVRNPASLTSAEQERKAHIESWGWEVTLLDDGASQAARDAAAGAAEVVYLPQGVSVSAGAGELNWAVGIVSEEGSMCPQVGIASGASTFDADTLDVVDADHPVTAGLDVGALLVASSAETVEHPSGTLASDATVLARRTGRTTPALVVIEAGGEGYGAAGSGLNADYYILSSAPSRLSDINFDAPPSATGVVSDINFPSTNGPGWPGGPNDDFAVRFTGKVTVPTSGTWHFRTNSDDGSALWINGTLVVNNDGLHGMQTVQGNISLTAGSHDIEVRGFERGGGYGLIVLWHGPGTGGPAVISGSAFSTGLAAGPRVHLPLGRFGISELNASGLRLFRQAMEWAAGPAGSGGESGLAVSHFVVSCCPSSLSSIDWNAAPTLTGTVPEVDIYVGDEPGWDGGPRDDFGVEFTGLVDVPASGTWTFYTESDDGSALWIGSDEVVSNDGLHSMRWASGTISLTAGQHPIRVRVFERSGQYGIRVAWQGPGVPTRTIIPASALSTGSGGGGGSGGPATYLVDWR